MSIRMKTDKVQMLIGMRYLFLAFLLSLSLGQLGRLPLPQKEIGLYAPDILLTLTIFSYLFYLFQNKKSLPRISLFNPIFCFVFLGFISLVLSLRLFSKEEIFIGGLYLIRWLAYSFVYFLSFEIVRVFGKKLIVKFLVLTGIFLAFFGFLQLLFFPDFSPMVVLGWDPHYYRLLSTFFDPNFCGGFFVLSLSLLVSLYLFEPRKILLFLSLVVYLALLLTYSRSSYFAFLLSMLVIGILKERKAALIALLVFFLSLQLNPRAKTRVEGAIAVDESASQRLTSWESAILVIKKHPLFGVGFNNYRYVQLKYGLVDPESLGGHAGAGVDSSFLFVWATTGIFGLLAYLWLLGKAAFLSYLKAKKDPLSLAFISCFVGVLFHSQFVNSLFFPPIIAFFWTLLGLSEVKADIGASGAI